MKARSQNHDWLWSLYSNCYDSLTKFYPYTLLLQSVAKKLDVSSTDRVIDLGAGTCNLEKKIQRGYFTCVDASKEMLRGATGKMSNLDYVVADLNRYPYPFESGKFDKLVSVNLLYNIVDMDSFFSEAKRLLKPGGRLVVTSSNKSGFGSLLRDHFSQPGMRGVIKSLIFFVPFMVVLLINIYIDKKFRGSFYSNDEVVRSLKAAGFNKIKIEPAYSGINFLVTADS